MGPCRTSAHVKGLPLRVGCPTSRTSALMRAVSTPQMQLHSLQNSACHGVSTLALNWARILARRSCCMCLLHGKELVKSLVPIQCWGCRCQCWARYMGCWSAAGRSHGGISFPTQCCPMAKRASGRAPRSTTGVLQCSSSRTHLRYLIDPLQAFIAFITFTTCMECCVGVAFGRSFKVRGIGPLPT